MLKVGDKVVCRLYNSADRKFSPDTWVREIVEINLTQRVADLGVDDKPYVVKRPGYTTLAVARKEILRKTK